MRVLSVTYSENPIRIGSHYHDAHQLLYVEAGSVEVNIDGEPHRVEGGELVILSRFEEHSVRVLTPTYKRYALRLSAEDGESHGEDYLLSSVLVNRTAQFRHVVRAEALKETFRSMVCEFGDNGPMREEMLALYLKQLFILLYRCASYLFPSSVNRNALLVRAVQKRFEEDCSQSFTLGSLAAEYHVSPSYFAHLFKETTGYAPIEYLMLCRLSTAKRYLCDTELAVKEIVERCGFSDESNFSRTFKARTSMTPSAFRQKYGKKS